MTSVETAEPIPPESREAEMQTPERAESTISRMQAFINGSSGQKT